MRIPHPGHAAEGARDAWRTPVSASRHTAQSHNSVLELDQLTLGRLYHALSPTGGNQRIERLASAVARGTYLVPAYEISQSLLTETLRP